MGAIGPQIPAHLAHSFGGVARLTLTTDALAIEAQQKEMLQQPNVKRVNRLEAAINVTDCRQEEMGNTAKAIVESTDVVLAQMGKI